MNILFVSRAYPPVLGGIERQNFELAQSLGRIADVTVVANTRGKKFLPFFLPYAMCRILFGLPRHDVLLLGDGVLAPLGALARILMPWKRVFAVIHGLDVTFCQKQSLMGRIYRAVNIPSLQKFDRLIMVGRHTIDEAVKVGVDRERCTFIPNGLYPDKLREPHTREELAKLLDMDLSGKKVILRVGRFVPHKGVPWFIDTVMPLLSDEFVFVAAGGRNQRTVGDRDAHTDAENAIRKHGLEHRVRLFPNLSEADKKILYNSADVYVSPNIDVPGSMEGFGINAIEAAACGRVVVCSDFQGLKDAISDGENGFMVPMGDARAWADKLREVLADDFDREAFGKKEALYTVEHFSWPGIAKRYLEVLSDESKSS
ncbi:MAG: glycosyltransferase family 4 protein [Candidatus Moranbacteria bacterium]|nr:glycosyltransferase family 4 protein [Candidatus Moranbacteria bacterium]NTW75562.1 glycosyltransferase family 4 protein [Candidatus Moranbacteria bacterium]